LANNIPLKNLQFLRRLNEYLTGQNLFAITDYSAIDPAAMKQEAIL